MIVNKPLHKGRDSRAEPADIIRKCWRDRRESCYLLPELRSQIDILSFSYLSFFRPLIAGGKIRPADE